MGVSVLVRCSLLMLCFVFVSKAQEVEVTELSITNAASVTYTAGGTGQAITVTLQLAETADDGTNGEVTAINVYFTNNADLRDAQIVKSDPVVHTLETPVAVATGSTGRLILKKSQAF
ncbi:uncharacterized protein [Ptychodera flava]|uniref:uncharacterized protein n=1 Tax=Ptychodera flava TaxID=63121 RepID=UPI00396A07DB